MYMDWDGHLDHCLEALRQAVMCKADTGVSAMRWSERASSRAKRRRALKIIPSTISFAVLLIEK